VTACSLAGWYEWMLYRDEAFGLSSKMKISCFRAYWNDATYAGTACGAVGIGEGRLPSALGNASHNARNDE